MKVLSLNVNDFGGMECLQAYSGQHRWAAWRAIDKTPAADAVLAYIQGQAPDVAVLQEVELNTAAVNRFIRQMEDLGYGSVPLVPHSYKHPSVTLLFSKLPYKPLPNPHQRGLRAGVIRVADCIVYGVHVPWGDMAFWDELTEFYQAHRDERLLMVGDFNVYKEGTAAKEKYRALLSLGARDAWTEKGYPHETPTFHKGTRIDYAILSPLIKDWDIQTDPALMNENQTDHAALIVTI